MCRMQQRNCEIGLYLANEETIKYRNSNWVGELSCTDPSAAAGGGSGASAEARYNLALAQMRAGQKKEAAETLKPLLSSPDVDTALLASDVFEDLDDTPQAVSFMRRAIVLDPMRPDSYMRFAELCMLHDSYQTGIDMVSAGIARLPHDSGLYLT